MEIETKKCPFCAEDIKAEALKCKHCGEFLNKDQELKPETEHKTITAAQKPSKSEQEAAVNGVAAILSLFIPGVGQMVKGHILAGLGWLFFTVLFYILFVVIGLVLHIVCITNAYSCKRA